MLAPMIGFYCGGARPGESDPDAAKRSASAVDLALASAPEGNALSTRIDSLMAKPNPKLDVEALTAVKARLATLERVLEEIRHFRLSPSTTIAMMGQAAASAKLVSLELNEARARVEAAKKAAAD